MDSDPVRRPGPERGTAEGEVVLGAPLRPASSLPGCQRERPSAAQSTVIQSAASSCNPRRRRCMPAFVAGGSARRASSRQRHRRVAKRSSPASREAIRNRVEHPGDECAGSPRAGPARRGSCARGSRVGVREPVRLARSPASTDRSSKASTVSDPPAASRSPSILRRPSRRQRPAARDRRRASRSRRRGSARRKSAPSARLTPDLQVRRFRAGQRARAEQRSPQVRAAAARARDDPPRRSLERSQSRVEHAAPCRTVRAVRSPLDVQLVTGRAPNARWR